VITKELDPPGQDAGAEPTIAAVIAASRRGHVPELDGLRAIAIWFVLVAHLLFTYPSTAASTAFLPHEVATVLEHGWAGVDLFFVLSGFLITGILLATKSRGSREYFRRFYARRAARILPLYFAVLIVLIVATRGEYASYFAFCALLSANLASFFNVPVPDAAGPYWSLAVEEQFYLFWPWFVLWFDVERVLLAAICVVVLEPFLRLGVHDHAFELMWYRADGLAMGAFLAAWFSTWNGELARARSLALGLVGIAVVITVVGIPFGILHQGDASTSFRITQLVCVFGALVVVSVAYSGTRILAPLRSQVLSVTALFSYCLYLVHKPISDGFAWALGGSNWYGSLPPETSLAFRVCCVLAIAYGAAALSRRFIELPFIKLGQRFS
jgi:peptidoglycan/LPS O-acetylase OafA/YrhL